MADQTRASPTITIYRGFPVKNTYVWSPFVNKLEARLRFAGVSYKIEQGSPREAPRGKIPYVGLQGTPDLLGDSALIIHRLVQDGVLPDLNKAISPVQQAHDLTIRSLLEDKLYFFLVHERWHDNYATMRSAVMAAIPYPIQLLIGLLAFRGVMRTLDGQGTTRLTAEEKAFLQAEVWENINILLTESRSKAAGSKQPFWIIGSDQPSDADATLYGFLAAGLVCDAAPETRKTIKSFPVIMDYASRIHEEYFPDYDRWSE